jgi:hypothetical protein
MKKPTSFLHFIICYAIVLAVVLNLHVVAQTEFAAIALFGSLMASLIAGLYHFNITDRAIGSRKALEFSFMAFVVWLIISVITFLVGRSLFHLPLESVIISEPSVTGILLLVFLSLASIFIGLMTSSRGSADE